MFVFDALMESIMCEDNTISAPTNVAKERLEELAKVNPTTKRSGYESQFQVSYSYITFSCFTVDVCYIRNYKKLVQKRMISSMSQPTCLKIDTKTDQ